MPQTREFVPPDVDPTRWASLQPLFRELHERPVESVDDLERWLIDRSELEAACSEARANLFIRRTCHTDDPEAQQAFARYLDEVPEKLKPAVFALDRRQVELFDRFQPAADRYEVLDRDTRAGIELFREENVALATELEKLDQAYDAIFGNMLIQFDGRERTLPQMARYQEATDREGREASWRAVAERRLAEADRIDGIFDRMLELRHRMARNADCETFVEYAFRDFRRFDYSPEDCLRFHAAIERHVVPIVRRLDARRAAALGVDTLRPWDLAVDPEGRPPLRPFEDGPDLVARSRAVFRRLDPSLASLFETLGDGRYDPGLDERGELCLDLDSRKGKAPGGYLYMRDRSLRPFIFMNAAGLQRDVETMVHEAGHAFHAMLCKDEPLLHYREPPIEFAEVASMAMELLTAPHWGGPDRLYPDPDDHRRAHARLLEGVLETLPWIATIDAFQHWLYRNPDHTHEERRHAWLDLNRRFGRGVSWQGLEPYLHRQWQRQGHLFGNAFYYIEYGIAQLGALQLWTRALDEGEDAAVEAYKRALAMGGSRPLPELFAAAGLTFDLGEPTVAGLAERVESRLEELSS